MPREAWRAAEVTACFRLVEPSIVERDDDNIARRRLKLLLTIDSVVAQFPPQATRS
jgi:hypothetical protein